MRQDLADKTLANYMNAALAWLVTIAKHPVTLHTADGRLHPYLAELLSQRRIWRQAQSKKEPITGAVFDALAQLAALQGFTSKAAAVYDWCRLGLFTGSRLSEYGQNRVTKAEPWAPIPSNADVPPEWRGRPIAFLADDFTFYNDSFAKIHHQTVFACGASTAKYVHVRFRYDKSVKIFVYRRYRQIEHSHVCPVKAAVSILERAKLLGPSIGVQAPLGHFWDDSRRRPIPISGGDMQTVMRQAVCIAYPDKNHYLRLHIDRIMSHSLRVTAAVALNNAGVSLKDIAFRLRWTSDAVELYIRDCYRYVGPVTESALAGAYLEERPPE